MAKRSRAVQPMVWGLCVLRKGDVNVHEDEGGLGAGISAMLRGEDKGKRMREVARNCND